MTNGYYDKTTIDSMLEDQNTSLNDTLTNQLKSFSGLSGYKVLYINENVTFDSTGSAIIERAGTVKNVCALANGVMLGEMLTFTCSAYDNKLLVRGYKGAAPVTGTCWINIFGLIK